MIIVEGFLRLDAYYEGFIDIAILFDEKGRIISHVLDANTTVLPNDIYDDYTGAAKMPTSACLTCLYYLP